MKVGIEWVVVLGLLLLGVGGIAICEHGNASVWQSEASQAMEQLNTCRGGWKETTDYAIQCRSHLDKCVELLSRGYGQ